MKKLVDNILTLLLGWLYLAVLLIAVPVILFGKYEKRKEVAS